MTPSRANPATDAATPLANAAEVRDSAREGVVSDDIIIVRDGKVLATRSGDEPCDPFNFPGDARVVPARLAEAAGDLLAVCERAVKAGTLSGFYLPIAERASLEAAIRKATTRKATAPAQPAGGKERL